MKTRGKAKKIALGWIGPSKTTTRRLAEKVLEASIRHGNREAVKQLRAETTAMRRTAKTNDFHTQMELALKEAIIEGLLSEQGVVELRNFTKTFNQKARKVTINVAAKYAFESTGIFDPKKTKIVREQMQIIAENSEQADAFSRNAVKMAVSKIKKTLGPIKAKIFVLNFFRMVKKIDPQLRKIAARFP